MPVHSGVTQLNLKSVIDSPYLAPVMTPLKWIGKSMAFVTGPYIRAAKASAQKKTVANPFLNYLDRLADEAPFLAIAPVLLGAVGGLIGGIVSSVHMLAGAGLAMKIVGGLAITSAVAASTVALAPLALGLAIAGATLVATTSVATIPGALVGVKTMVDHVLGRGAAPVASAPSAAPQSPSTIDQIMNHVSTLSEQERQAVLDRLTNKAANDFAASAAPAAAELDKDIAISQPIKLKKNTP